MSSQCAYQQRRAVLALLDELQVPQPVDVDDVSGGGQPHLHQGNQAHAAGKYLHVPLVLPQESRGLLDGARREIMETAGQHDGPARHFRVLNKLFSARGQSGREVPRTLPRKTAWGTCFPLLVAITSATMLTTTSSGVI